MWIVIISASFKSILSQSRCSLEPKNFLKEFCPLKPLMRGSEDPQTPSSFDDLFGFPLIMFTHGFMSIFDVILLSAGFPDIHPGHNKTTWD